MTTYVLIWFIMRGMAITSGNVEFASKKQCEVAGNHIIQLKNAEFNAYHGFFLCERKYNP